MKSILVLISLLSFPAVVISQISHWQQRVEYKIDVRLNHENHEYSGSSVIKYFNNSPDVLEKMYFHLYPNAFQPGSGMDVQSRNIVDPDPRVGDRIFKLTSTEEGRLSVKSIKIDGAIASIREMETILEITPPKPIKSNSAVTIELTFEGQVPVQIRRSGRNNAEGIDYSMSQWYPKVCEYDANGWHPNPYLGREFYGVWGSFEVNITLDRKFVVAATGILQNPDEMGCGYSDKKDKESKSAQKTWKFKAENVHDFVWAADPDYQHDIYRGDNSPELHFFYLNDKEYAETWREVQPLTAKAFDYMSKNFGQYPYSIYSIIQGGDGGMEYPMATLVTGHRKLPSLAGVIIHEAAHSWYYGILATNESKFCWMDEGFTSFATSETHDHVFGKRSYSDHRSAYTQYIEMALSGKEEDLDTHADHFKTNDGYGVAAYSKGEAYLAQLNYVMGDKAFRDGLLLYFDRCKFKHPDSDDFLHTMELSSGMVLDWYNESFVHSTRQIDYAIAMLDEKPSGCDVYLVRKGDMPMPVELTIAGSNGKTETHYIPFELMRANKPDVSGSWIVHPAWRVTDTVYKVSTSWKKSDMQFIEIDPNRGMADVNRKNNLLKPDELMQFIELNNH